MDINNIPQTRVNEVKQQNVSQTQKAKDTEFQAEKGRDLLGVQGDSRYALVGNVISKNGLNTNLKIEKANIEDLKAIHKIDLEAFEGSYSIDSGFEEYKADLEEQGISTYAIKSDKGDVVGYYQLEPVENGELYIYSIGVRSDLRSSKTSYAAIKQMQENITNFAQENGIEKVSLDVDASKPELVKLYKKFGFEVTAENRGFEAGQQYHDLHMVADVNKVLGGETSVGAPVKESKTLPIINGLVPQQTGDAKALEIAKKMGLTETDINDLKQKYSEFNNIMNAIDIVSKYVDKREYDRERALEFFTDMEQPYVGIMPYITEENIQFLKKKNNTEEDVTNEIIDQVLLYESNTNNSELTQMLKEATKINHKGHSVPRFDTGEIKIIVDAFKKNSDLAQILLDETKLDYNGETVPRFDGYDIKEVIDIYERKPDFVQTLLDETMIDYKGRTVPRFGGHEIRAIIEADEKKPDLTKNLLSATKNGYNGKTEPRFNGYEIKSIIEAYEKNPELTKDLLSVTKNGYNGQSEPRFNGYDIKAITKAYEKNPDLTKILLDETIVDLSGKILPRFSGREIEPIVNLYETKPDFTKKLLDAKTINSNGHAVPLFSPENIAALSGSSKADIEIIERSIDFFDRNIDSLQHQDMDVTDSMILEIMVKNAKGVLNVVNIVGETGLRHAKELKYKGLKQFLENANSLKSLNSSTKAILKSKLEQLPHPEQKLNKLEIIAAVSGEVNEDVILEVINKINNPQMSKSQKELADVIFSTDKPYAEQVDDFIREFNVPPKREHQIRKFLFEQRLNEKYVTPPSIEEQVAIIDKKIQSIKQNDKIPTEKKEVYLAQLETQKIKMLKKPEEYTRPRINDRAMKPLEAQVEAHINLPNQNQEFTNTVNEQVYKLLGVPVTEELLSAVNYDSKYISKIFSGLSNSDFKNNFRELIEQIKANPDKKFTEIIRDLPENIETEKLFEENNLNFERWMNFDPESSQPFTVTVKVEKSVEKARQNLITELTSGLAKRLDATEMAKLNKILKDNDIDSAGQKDLPRIIKLIEQELDTNEYWSGDSADIKTFKDHIKIHKKNIHAVKQLKDSTEELSVRLWDKDNVGRNIFFGNHVGCCTSVDSFNSFAAPQHLMNTFVNGIEIVDKAGNSMGNSMCYFAKVDGKLTFVIDSFEANGKLGAAPEVTDAIIAYAQKVCAEMGQPEANIMFGPNYNKIDFTRCIKTDGHSIEVIGKAPTNTYIDSIGGKGDINVPFNNRPMHEIMDL